MKSSGLAIRGGPGPAMIVLVATLAFLVPHLVRAQESTIANEEERATSSGPAPGRSAGLVAGGHVRIRVRVEPEEGEGIVVGQQVRLLIEVLTDTRFSRAPRYQELTLSGVISLLPEQMGTNFTELIDGRTFSGQRRAYVLYPLRPGVIRIPPLEIPVGILEAEGHDVEVVLRTSPVRFRVAARAGVDEEEEQIVTTPRLEIEDEWDRSFEALEAGEAVVRRVSIRGSEILGMLLPALDFEAPTGIAVYPDPPRILDRVNRGQYRGERVQTVTYVLQEGGSFELEPIEVRWWDPESDRLRVEVLSGQTMEVNEAGFGASNASALSRSLARWGKRSTGAVMAILQWLYDRWLVVVLFVALVAALARLVPVARRRFQAALDRAKVRREASEVRAFKALERSLRSTNMDEIVKHYWQWRDRLSPSSDARGRRSSGAGVRLQSDPAFTDEPMSQWRILEAARYGPSRSSLSSESIDAAVLRRELRSWRSELLGKRRSVMLRRRAARFDAYELNPRS